MDSIEKLCRDVHRPLNSASDWCFVCVMRLPRRRAIVALHHLFLGFLHLWKHAHLVLELQDHQQLLHVPETYGGVPMMGRSYTSCQANLRRDWTRSHEGEEDNEGTMSLWGRHYTCWWKRNLLGSVTSGLGGIKEGDREVQRVKEMKLRTTIICK